MAGGRFAQISRSSARGGGKVMVAAFAFRTEELPQGLRFDGVMDGEDRSFLQFTELDGGPSHGASFYIDSRAALLHAIIARREEKRVEFQAGENLETRNPGQEEKNPASLPGLLAS